MTDETDALVKLSGKYGIRWWCMGCECFHLVPAKQLGAAHAERNGSGVDDGWDFNLDYQHPTLNPSVLVYGHEKWNAQGEAKISAGNYELTDDDREKTPRCHTFIANGFIQFLADCEHPYAGQTVQMIPVSEWSPGTRQNHGLD